MKGLPNFNRSAFDYAARHLRLDHWEVFNPVDWSIQLYGEGLFDNPMGDIEYARKRYGYSERAVLSADLRWICEEATAIYLLTGWRSSPGSRAEYAAAEALGLSIFTKEFYPLRHDTIIFGVERTRTWD